MSTSYLLFGNNRFRKKNKHRDCDFNALKNTECIKIVAQLFTCCKGSLSQWFGFFQRRFDLVSATKNNPHFGIFGTYKGALQASQLTEILRKDAATDP